MRTIAILNQKGGVGKTTTVTNTAAALAAMGSKVLTIDLDPQAHLTIHFGIEPQNIEAGAYKVLTQSAEVSDAAVQSRENLWLLPANINLVGAESELVSVVGREIILREALQKVNDRFDYCLIDCPPSLGLLTLNALAAAQEVLIPLQPHFLALQGVGKLLQTVELVNKRINPELRVEGILLCMFDTRASLPSEVRADIQEFLSNARGTNCAWADAQILPTFIRRNIKLAEAPSYGKTIFEYEQNCHGAEDYKEVAEFIHKGSRSHGQRQKQASAPIAIRDIPKASEPVAAPQQEAPAKAPEPQQPIPQAANPPENPAPTPIPPAARPSGEPKPAAEPRPRIESSPLAQNNPQPAPQPKPRLTSTYEYRPQPPAPQRPAQTPQQPSNTSGIQPVAQNSPPQRSIPAQAPRQTNGTNVRRPQPPASNIPAGSGNPQPTPQLRRQSNNTYQYRAPSPVAHKPVPPRSVQPQPKPKPPMNSANPPQARPPIQNAPATPNNLPVAAQPASQPNANTARPQAATPNRPVAPQPAQSITGSNSQQVSRNVNSQAPVEIKPVPKNASQTPQQQAASRDNGQVRAARIIEITPPGRPTPIAKPTPPTPTEPTHES
ncbi:MAG: ParA family protein [Planctomycetota bacterium]|jgi:chromosome partitioning protein